MWESIQLTTLGRSPQVFQEILKEAQDLAMKNSSGSTVIYTTAGGDWRKFGFPRKRRPLHSVILDSAKDSKILEDVKEFLRSGQWYLDTG